MSLPTELLQMILVTFTEILFDTSNNHNVIKGMLAVTHVCSRLRSVAIGFPQMWFPICFQRWDSWKITTLFVDRGALLRLSNHYDSLNHRTGISSLAYRIESIDLDLTARRLVTFPFDVGSTFPSLVSLKLRQCSEAPLSSVGKKSSIVDRGTETPVSEYRVGATPITRRVLEHGGIDASSMHCLHDRYNHLAVQQCPTSLLIPLRPGSNRDF